MLTLTASLLLIASAITIYQPITQAFATPTTEEAWSVYSDNGVYFEYPSTWNMEHISPYGVEIVVINPNRENGFIIGLPNQQFQERVFSQYSSLQDFANDFVGKMVGYTIIEEFTEKIFNGFPAVAGKISYLDTTIYTAFIDYHGQIYGFQYHDVANEFDSVDSQRTMLKVIGTFGFL